MIFTSHDRHFTKRVATCIVEVRDGRVTNYSGQYDAYLYKVNKEIEAGERELAAGRAKLPPEVAKPAKAAAAPARRNERDVRKEIKAAGADDRPARRAEAGAQRPVAGIDRRGRGAAPAQRGRGPDRAARPGRGAVVRVAGGARRGGLTGLPVTRDPGRVSYGRHQLTTTCGGPLPEPRDRRAPDHYLSVDSSTPTSASNISSGSPRPASVLTITADRPRQRAGEQLLAGVRHRHRLVQVDHPVVEADQQLRHLLGRGDLDRLPVRVGDDQRVRPSPRPAAPPASRSGRAGCRSASRPRGPGPGCG